MNRADYLVRVRAPALLRQRESRLRTIEKLKVELLGITAPRRVTINTPSQVARRKAEIARLERLLDTEGT